MSDKPTGKSYSQIYVERGAASEDSERLRNRLRAYLRRLPDHELDEIAGVISQETGARLYSSIVGDHLTKCTLVDLLDNITHAFTALKATRTHSNPHPHFEWILFVDRCMKEENVSYVVAEDGVVHPAHDDEFDASRRATIAALGLPRYATARQFFEEAITDLKPPQDTRDAVRRAFEAVENVAKLMVSTISRLGATEVEKAIKPLIITSLTGAERDAANRMLASLAEWVNACQQYRHAPGTPEPDPPTLELAIWMVSCGAAHLRWLVGADQKLLAP